MTEAIVATLALRDALWIAESIATRHRVTLDELLGRDRSRRPARARRELYGCLYASGWSLSEIGRTLDRDHTTVLYGVRADLAA